jgi:hypothetical protein
MRLQKLARLWMLEEKVGKGKIRKRKKVGKGKFRLRKKVAK